MKYTARAPLRIDFGGSWTCIPSAVRLEPGVALCGAIDRYAEGSIALPWGEGPFQSFRSDKRTVTTSLDLPIGAGLAASAAQTVLWIALLRSVIDNTADRTEIAGIACDLQRNLGTLVGQQDAFASALGGITSFTIGSEVTPVRVEPAPVRRDELADRMVLLWTTTRGGSRDVAAMLGSMIEEGNLAAINGLCELRRNTADMISALRTGDVDATTALVDEHWKRQREIAPGVVSESARELEALARSFGAVAVKACGIAGGMLLAIAPRGYRGYLADQLALRKVRVLGVRFDSYGVFLRKA